MALRQFRAAVLSSAGVILTAGALTAVLAIVGVWYFSQDSGKPGTQQMEAREEAPERAESRGHAPPRKTEESREAGSRAGTNDGGDKSAADISVEGQVPNSSGEAGAVSVSAIEKLHRSLAHTWDSVLAAISSILEVVLVLLTYVLILGLIIGLLIALGWGVWRLYHWGVRNPILALSERVEALEAECKRLRNMLQNAGHNIHAFESTGRHQGISDDPVLELRSSSPAPRPWPDTLTLYRQSLRNFDRRDEFLRKLDVEGLERVEKTGPGEFRFVPSGEATSTAPLWCIDSADRTVFVVPGTSIVDRLAYFSQDGGWRARQQFGEFYEIEENTSFGVSEFAKFRQDDSGRATLLNKGRLSMPVR